MLTEPSAGLRARIQARPGYRWLVLVTLLVGLFAVGLNFTLLSVILPDLAREFHTDKATMQWVVSGPILVFGVASPIVGKLGDMYGARRTYLVGFGLAIVFLFLTALSWDYPSLLAFRLLSALEGAATGPATVKFITTVFGPEERPKALGWWSMVAAGGPTIGLVVGAVVIPVSGWRAMYAGQALLCVPALVVAWLVLRETPRQRVRFDLAGAVLLGASMLALLFAIDRGSKWGLGDPRIVVALVATPLLFVAFARVEQRNAAPVFPLHYFSVRNFGISLGAAALVNFAYLGGFMLANPLMSDLLHYSKSTRFLVVLSRPGAFVLVAPFAGYLVARVGERRVAMVGTGCVLAAMLAMSTVDASSPLPWLVFGLAVAGAGLGCAQPALGNALVNSMRPEDQGLGGGLAGAVQSIGSSGGSVVLVAVQEAFASGGVAASYAAAFRVGGVAAVMAVVLTTFLRRGTGGRTPSASESLASDLPATGEPL